MTQADRDAVAEVLADPSDAVVNHFLEGEFGDPRDMPQWRRQHLAAAFLASGVVVPVEPLPGHPYGQGYHRDPHARCKSEVLAEIRERVEDPERLAEIRERVEDPERLDYDGQVYDDFEFLLFEVERMTALAAKGEQAETELLRLHRERADWKRWTHGAEAERLTEEATRAGTAEHNYRDMARQAWDLRAEVERLTAERDAAEAHVDKQVDEWIRKGLSPDADLIVELRAVLDGKNG